MNMLRTCEFLNNLASGMTGAEKDFSIEQCQMIINQWRLDNNDDVPAGFTAKMLHDLYNGTPVSELQDKLARAAGYTSILMRYNWLSKDAQRLKKSLEKQAAGEDHMTDQQLRDLREDYRLALEKADCLFYSLTCMGVPLTQIYNGDKTIWVIDVDRL